MIYKLLLRGPALTVCQGAMQVDKRKKQLMIPSYKTYKLQQGLAFQNLFSGAVAALTPCRQPTVVCKRDFTADTINLAISLWNRKSRILEENLLMLFS